MMRGILRALMAVGLALPMVVGFTLPTRGFTLKGDIDLGEKLEAVTPLKEGVYGLVTREGLMNEFKVELDGKGYKMTTPYMFRRVTFYVAPEPYGPPGKKAKGKAKLRYVAQVCDKDARPKCMYGLSTIAKDIVSIEGFLPVAKPDARPMPDAMKALLDGPDTTGSWEAKSVDDLLVVLAMLRGPGAVEMAGVRLALWPMAKTVPIAGKVPVPTPRPLPQ